MDRLISILRQQLPQRRELLSWTLLFCAFLITAKVGQLLYRSGSAPTLIWPPVGIALAAIYLRGYRMWTAIALASIIANVSAGAAFITIVGSAVGNTIQPLLGGYVFRYFNLHPSIRKLRDTLALTGVAIIVTSIAPTTLLILQTVAGVGGDTLAIWRIIWTGGTLSVLVITPLIVCWVQDSSPLREQMLERLLAFTTLITISYVIFWTDYGQLFGIPLVYLVLVPLFWLGLRFRPRSVALGLFALTAIGISGTMVMYFGTELLGTRLFNLQLFLQIMSFIFLVFSSVVEERRRIAEELQRRISQLQDALERIRSQDQAKSEFLAILAHELRNPLAPALNTIELFKLKRGKAKEDVALLEGVEGRLHAMGRLLDDLLDVSRISERRLRLQKTAVEVKPLIQRSIETVRHLMEKHRHITTFSYPDEITWVHGDPLRLEQILVNLLTNAAKYTDPGGVIKVAGIRHRDSVTISVSDNGNGIAHDMLDRIFEPFLQIPSKKGVSGVGIGLSLARQLVEMHGGTVTAYSAGLGLGSTFSVTLPVTHTPVDTSVAPEPVRPKKSAAKKRILVIDDNHAGAEALSRLLTYKGHEVRVAHTGASGIDQAMTEHPDAILLDIGLPDIDGYEVAHQLRLAGSTAILIALTGYGQADDIAKAKAAGFHHHLTKPVGFADIERCLLSEASI